MRAFRLFAVSLAVVIATSRVAAAGWTITTFDPAMGSGWSTSERIASHPLMVDDWVGVPHISYWASGQGFRYYDGNSVVSTSFAAPGTPDETQLLRTGYTSLALDANNEPWIAEGIIDQNDQSRGPLVVVHRAAGVWTSDPIGIANGPPSLEFDRTNGIAHLFYLTQAGPVYAWHDGGGWHSEAFDSVGSYGTLRLDPTGQPALAYVTIPSSRLYYATRSGGAWHSQLVDGSGIAAAWPSLRFTGTGHPRILYGDASGGQGTLSLRYAEESLGSWTTEPILAANGSAFQSSLALLGDIPFVAYHDAIVDKVFMATRNGGTWSAENVDPLVGAGQFPSIAIDGGYRPVISYMSTFGSGARYATGSTVVGVGEVPVGARGVRLTSGPNPSLRGATVALTASVAMGGNARLLAFDAAGRTVGAARSLVLLPGENRVQWVAPPHTGLVFLRLEIEGGAIATARMVVL